MFVPSTKDELKALDWEQPDIILVSGDTYIDIPNDGTALIAKYLIMHGFKAAIISQPDINSDVDIARLGEPKLFWGVSGGCVDSIVANYTALHKKRRLDDLTPGGENNRRPDRAVIAYTNLIKKYFKSNKPIVIGGIEASLRRLAHYDYLSDKLRKSILADSKADILFYGMAEKSILEYANKLKNNQDTSAILGTCILANTPPKDYIELPSIDECVKDKNSFIQMFNAMYQNADPLNAKGLYQQTAGRYIVQHPPQPHLTTKELDEIYSIKWERDAQPYEKKKGKIKALETMKFSITSHRGCYGECNFCAIAVHQGRKIISRSKESIIEEVKSITKHKDFKGVISDIGGATANMYQNSCEIMNKSGACKNKRCTGENICSNLNHKHNNYIDLLNEIRHIDKVKKVIIASGIRYDLILNDTKFGGKFLTELIKYHISGQLKIAPEHTDEDVLKAMSKPGSELLMQFVQKFYEINNACGLNQFLSYYFISSHPGETQKSVLNLQDFLKYKLKFTPEQIQIFTPTPSTYSTLMYYTELNPLTNEKIFVEKSLSNKSKVKDNIQNKRNDNTAKKKR